MDSNSHTSWSPFLFLHRKDEMKMEQNFRIVYEKVNNLEDDILNLLKVFKKETGWEINTIEIGNVVSNKEVEKAVSVSGIGFGAFKIEGDLSRSKMRQCPNYANYINNKNIVAKENIALTQETFNSSVIVCNDEVNYDLLEDDTIKLKKKPKTIQIKTKKRN